MRNVQDLSQDVVLPWINDAEAHKGNYSSAEPQFVKQRSNNLATLFVDSDGDSITGTANESGKLFLTDVQRVGVSKVAFYWDRFNVSDGSSLSGNGPTQNNTLTIHSSVTALDYTITVPPGNYTLTDLLTQITTLLNLTASGLVFSSIILANTQRYIITATGGQFYFQPTTAINSSSMVENGKYLLDLVANNTLAATYEQQAMMLATKYLEIRSESLTREAKNRNNTNSLGGSQVIYRYYFANNDNVHVSEKIKNIVWINFERDRSIDKIDAVFYDAYNKKIENIDYNLEIISEL